MGFRVYGLGRLGFIGRIGFIGRMGLRGFRAYGV